MKSLLPVAVLGAGLLLPQGCAGQPIDPPQPTGRIESFGYSYGSDIGGWSYELTREADGTHFETQSSNGEDLDMIVDDAVWGELQGIVTEHELDDWDGIDESADVMDGYGYTLTYVRADGSTVDASEYGGDSMTAPGYGAAHADLTEFLEALAEES